MGCRLHVGGSVHKICRPAPSTPSPVPPAEEWEMSGDLDDRAILVSGDDEEDGDVEEIPERVDDDD